MGEKTPNNWVLSSIGEVLDVNMGQSPPSSSYNEEGIGIAFMQGKTEFGDYYPKIRKYTTEPKKVVKADTILLSVRAPIGPTNVSPLKLCIGRGLAGISSEILPLNFLLYYLRSIEQKLDAKGTGTTFKAISKDKLLGTDFPLPPLPEQERIVAKLDQLFGHLDQVKERLARVPELLKNFRQSVLTQAVTGKLTEEWRVGRELEEVNLAEVENNFITNKKVYENYKSENRWNTSKNPWKENPEIPSTWKWFIADEIKDQETDIVYGIVQPGPHLESGIPYVRGKDIQNGKILIDQLLFTSEEISLRYKKATLLEGDVLLGIIRNTKVALVPKELNGGNITQGTARIRPSIFLNPKFLELVMLSPLIQSWLHSNYRGIDMPGLNLKDVRKMPIPLASEKEQTEIVKRVEGLFKKADAIEAQYHSLKQNIASLPQAILAKAFKGELVPQLPTDGDAKDLLEEIKRLKGESEVSGKKKRRTKSYKKKRAQVSLAAEEKVKYKND